MRPFAIISTLLLGFSTNILAAKQDRQGWFDEGQYQNCLTNRAAEIISSNYARLIAHAPGWQELAANMLTEDFSEAGDSASFQVQKPLNVSIAHNRAEFLEYLDSFHHRIEIPKTLFLSNTCDTITWYNTFHLPNGLPIRCIAILFVNDDGMVYKVYREQNTAAVLYSEGKPECQPGFKVSVGHEGLPYQESSCQQPVDDIYGYQARMS